MLKGVLVAALLSAPAGPGLDRAVQWRTGGDASEPDASSRERLREAIAEQDGRPTAIVHERAFERARLAVAHELPARARASHRALRRSLDEADAAYREGRFDDALVEIDAALDQLHADPGLPGAAASAREAHLLAAKLAWARGESERAEQALRDALRLDPEARLSLREATPELVERHEALRAASLAEREREWVEPHIVWPGDPVADLLVEIDGVAGLRPVPPGAHFIVARVPGFEPFAAWRTVEDVWELPRRAQRITEATRTSDVEAVCETLALELLILAERRSARVGLQARRCGVGYGPAWFGPPERLALGVQEIFAGPFDGSELELEGSWPNSLVESTAGEPALVSEPPKPWYRKGWIWGTSAGVALAVAGVAAGVLLGTREPPLPTVEVDAGQFIGGP